MNQAARRSAPQGQSDASEFVRWLGERTPHQPGTRVRFKLAHDIEAIVEAAAFRSAALGGITYELAWIHSGSRQNVWVSELEIEALPVEALKGAPPA